MTEIKTDITAGAIKLSPPAVTVLGGYTSDQIIAVLTIVYLTVLIGHQAWRWWAEIKKKNVSP